MEMTNKMPTQEEFIVANILSAYSVKPDEIAAKLLHKHGVSEKDLTNIPLPYDMRIPVQNALRDLARKTS